MNMGALALELSHEGRQSEAERLFEEELQTASKTKRTGLISMAWYDSGCGSAIAGRHDVAFTYLQRAVDIGHQAVEDIASDPDLKSLHSDPRFETLLARARNRAASANP